MATHPSILAWEISWTRGAWWATYNSWGCKRARHNLATKNNVPKIISRKGLSPQKGNVLVHLDYCSEILCEL